MLFAVMKFEFDHVIRPYMC